VEETDPSAPDANTMERLQRTVFSRDHFFPRPVEVVKPVDSKYRRHIDLISLAFDNDIVMDVLSEIRKVIDRIVDQTNDFMKDQGRLNAEITWANTDPVIEALYGAAFVVCQASITAIASRVQDVHTCAEGEGKELASTPRTKRDLLKFQSTTVPGKHVTEIQAIDALANYFKHNHQWPRGWINPTKQNKETIDTLELLGIRFGGTKTLRTAMESLFESDLPQIATVVITNWHTAIVNKLKEELTS
jgi:hypothetical protein